MHPRARAQAAGVLHARLELQCTRRPPFAGESVVEVEWETADGTSRAEYEIPPARPNALCLQRVTRPQYSAPSVQTDTCHFDLHRYEYRPARGKASFVLSSSAPRRSHVLEIEVLYSKRRVNAAVAAQERMALLEESERLKVRTMLVLLLLMLRLLLV